jgi:NAD(P)-dependent dehydrogenase (short-subunit alcohol dehydrogenase family)
MPITSTFGAQSTAAEVIEGIDLSAHHALVTGGAAGIGAETVRALVAGGADVTVAVRSPAVAASLAGALREEYPGAAVHVIELDLGDLETVRRGAAAFLARGVALDILVNNAGVMATPLSRTAEGFELQFGTNHLGHFVLATELVPALRRANGARVVSLSSVGHRRSEFVPADPNYRTRPYERWEAYGQSKTANALFAVGLTARFGDDGIHANAVMPGGILTGLQKHLSRADQIALGWIDEDGAPNPRFKTPAQGAATTVWAAVAPELDGVGGRYLENCAEAEVMDPATPYAGYMPYALDPAMADVLWDVSAQLTKAT